MTKLKKIFSTLDEPIYKPIIIANRPTTTTRNTEGLSITTNNVKSQEIKISELESQEVEEDERSQKMEKKSSKLDGFIDKLSKELDETKISYINSNDIKKRKKKNIELNESSDSNIAERSGIPFIFSKQKVYDVESFLRYINSLRWTDKSDGLI